jgi:integrase
MSIYQRQARGAYYTDVRWRGYPRVQVSTGTTNKARAKAMLVTLRRLCDVGRRDVVALVASGRLRLADVHDDYIKGPEALEQRIARTSSPALGDLVEQWLAYLDSPAALSEKTKRPFAPKTRHRYWQSWQRLFAAFPKGRRTPLSDITKGLLSDYRTVRINDGKTGATVNRDMVALQSFLRWARTTRDLTVAMTDVPRQRESQGRERWLESDEIVRLRAELPTEWWPLFGMLLFTGLRVGEAQGLSWSHVRLAERVIRVRGGSRMRDGDAKRRLKTESSERDVPIADELATEIARLAATLPTGPSDPVFPGDLGDYHCAYRAFRRARKAAKLDGVTIHDLRHTFAVHWVLAGLPIARLQKILGHATPTMTMRYMRHAPEGFFAHDAAKVAASLNGIDSREASARAELAREALKLA